MVSLFSSGGRGVAVLPPTVASSTVLPFISFSACEKGEPDPILLVVPLEVPASASRTAFMAASVISNTCCSVNVVSPESKAGSIDGISEEALEIGFVGFVAISGLADVVCGWGEDVLGRVGLVDSTTCFGSF